MSRKQSVFKQKFALKAALIFSIAVLLFSLATSRVNAVVTGVSPSNMNGWAFEVNSPDGFGTFVTGPETPPLGVGSVRLFTGTNGNLSIALHNVSYGSVKLSDITRLDYSTYSNSSGPSESKYPLLILNLSTTFGPDELNFNPVDQSQISQLNTWQTWSTVDGVWKSNRFPQFSGNLSAYIAGVGQSPEDITLVNAGTGAVRMQAGPASTTDVFDENVDNFTIGINGGDITFDFEPDVLVLPSPSVSPDPILPGTPTNKDQCKNGGWNTFRSPVFRNQGDCISFVNNLTKIKPN